MNGLSLSVLPTVNACLNATSAVLLVTGLWLVRVKRIAAHTVCMMMACAVSLLFLTSYLIYHARAGVTHFVHQGWIRPTYFAVLVSHTILAILIVPLVGRTLYLAVRRRFVDHQRLARVTLPLWLYVSVTGVVVYWMLYHWPGNQ